MNAALQQGAKVARGGVRITAVKTIGPNATEEITWVALFDLNAQSALEERVSQDRGKYTNLTDIVDDMRFRYSAKLGIAALWSSMLAENPDFTIDDAKKFHIDNRVKFLLLTAMNQTRTSQEDLDELADAVAEADDVQIKNALRAMKETQKQITKKTKKTGK